MDYVAVAATVALGVLVTCAAALLPAHLLPAHLLPAHLLRRLPAAQLLAQE